MDYEKILGLYEKGKNHYLNKDYINARKYLEEFIKYRDNFADVYNYLGYIYYVSNDINRAVEFYKKAVELNPYYTEALINLIVILHQIGEYEEAEKYMKNLKNTKNIKGLADKYCLGKLANKHAEIARMYRSLFLYREAAGEYKKALKLAPDFPDLRLEYANLLRDMGKLEDAVVQYDEVLVRKPDYTDVHLNLAITYYKLGYIGFCIEALKKAKELNPKNRTLQTFIYLIENAKEVDGD